MKIHKSDFFSLSFHVNSFQHLYKFNTVCHFGKFRMHICIFCDVNFQNTVLLKAPVHFIQL